MKEIKGRVVYNDLEGGFWGIIDEDGKKYVPVNMPEQLKIENKWSTIVLTEKSFDAGIQMWGTYVEIISFET